MNKSAQASEPPQPMAVAEESIPARVRSLTNSLFEAFQAKMKSAAGHNDEPAVELFPCRE
jgi:hypothetical protein